MLNWLQRLMYGRYGTDQLNLFLLVFSIVASLILRFTPVWYLGCLTYLPLGYALFRMFSRNISKRQAENQTFLRLTAPAVRWFRTRFARAKDGTHRYFACPKCRQTCRVPKGRGKIQITCPVCGHSFIKKA